MDTMRPMANIFSPSKGFEARIKYRVDGKGQRAHGVAEVYAVYGEKVTEAQAEHGADAAAYAAHDRALGKEEPEHLAALKPHGLEYAYLPAPLEHHHHQDVGDDEGPEEGDHEEDILVYARHHANKAGVIAYGGPGLHEQLFAAGQVRPAPP
jgi:hypothetical protein